MAEEQISQSQMTGESGVKTTMKSLGLGGVTGGGAPCAVDYKDGKIIRIRPFHFDWKYQKEQLNPWKLEVRGKTLEPSLKSLPSPFSLAYKKRVLSPNRIKYPLKRVDWNPNGERNPQNRGKSKYERITWDEAAEIIAGEIKRVNNTYGPMSILMQGDGHGECKSVHATHGCSTLLLNKVGGFTQQCRNPDSWEGWYWGAKHVWGDGYVGMMSPTANVTKDISEHSQQVLFWGCDPETTPWGFSGQSATSICYFWKELGIKQVYICPDLNYGAAIHADKWIPILPNTDSALQLAIIYMWIKEGTYDKEYVATHTIGFEKVEAYVLGKEDGTPKTPEWASKKCGVSEWTIKALAREFAHKVTSIAHYFGGSYIRGPYSHEPARLECILLGMQGLGKPGVHQCRISLGGMPRSNAPRSTQMTLEQVVRFGNPGPWTDMSPTLNMMHLTTTNSFSKQFIPKTLLQDAILDPPISFWGTGAICDPTEGQFVKYTYPIPKEEGGTEIHMIWTDTPCRTTCWNHGNKTVEAFQSPKIECVVAQHPWLENDCLVADIILPINTKLEEKDLQPNIREGGGQFLCIGMEQQTMESIGESKSDYEAVLEVAKKFGMEEQVSEGRSIDDWIRFLFDKQYEMSQYVSWEEFEQKGYYVFPIAADWENDPAGMIDFYKDPLAHPLRTPSGKLEFYSERLAKHFPDDQERPPIPKWIEKSETHDERISGDRARSFPLLMISNHGRWRVHAQCDDIAWTREISTCKVKGGDGYLYEPVWINPQDAAERGIKTGDIVKVFNERGVVLGGATVWERIMPGVVYMDHGARVDYIKVGEVDRGGAVNLIAPNGIASKHCGGEATSGYLVNVQKVTMSQMEEWKQQYPEAFERKYDPVSGLRFDAWVVEMNRNKDYALF